MDISGSGPGRRGGLRLGRHVPDLRYGDGPPEVEESSTEIDMLLVRVTERIVRCEVEDCCAMEYEDLEWVGVEGMARNLADLVGDGVVALYKLTWGRIAKR